MSTERQPDSGAPPRHVMLAIPTLERAGPDKVFSLLATGLYQRGWKVDIALGNPVGELVAELPSGVQVLPIPRWGPGILQRQPVPGLTTVVRQRRPDVVLATLRMNVTAGIAKHWFPPTTKLVLRPANHQPSSTAELGTHHPKYWLAGRLDHFATRRADAIVAQSKSLADAVMRTGFNGPIKVIGNPVMPFAPGTSLPELSGEPAVVAVGRLSEQKGFDVLLECFPQVVMAHPGVHLHLVGVGPAEASLRTRVRELNLPVTFHGMRADAVAMMMAADLVVSSSRYEGFSNVILEAQSVGTPVVATDCPGAASEVLGQTDGGMIAQAGNAVSLANGIVEVLKHPDRFDRSTIASKTLDRWSVDAIVNSYTQYLNRIIASPPTDRARR